MLVMGKKVPQVPLEKEKAIEDALRYFKMIELKNEEE
jgi:hypothetical protein